MIRFLCEMMLLIMAMLIFSYTVALAYVYIMQSLGY